MPASTSSRVCSRGKGVAGAAVESKARQALAEQRYLALTHDDFGSRGVGPDGWNSRTGEESGGLGLRNILQRLTALYRNSAQLSIQSAIPHGTRVTLLLPLQIATLQTAGETA